MNKDKKNEEILIESNDSSNFTNSRISNLSCSIPFNSNNYNNIKLSKKRKRNNYTYDRQIKYINKLEKSQKKTNKKIDALISILMCKLYGKLNLEIQHEELIIIKEIKNKEIKKKEKELSFEKINDFSFNYKKKILNDITLSNLKENINNTINTLNNINTKINDKIKQNNENELKSEKPKILEKQIENKIIQDNILSQINISGENKKIAPSSKDLIENNIADVKLNLENLKSDDVFYNDTQSEIKVIHRYQSDTESVNSVFSKISGKSNQNKKIRGFNFRNNIKIRKQSAAQREADKLIAELNENLKIKENQNKK